MKNQGKNFNEIAKEVVGTIQVVIKVNDRQLQLIIKDQLIN